jgi:hypothetical protein
MPVFDITREAQRRSREFHFAGQYGAEASGTAGVIA